jgi:patatin-like phospholipase/acyl hydrolase
MDRYRILSLDGGGSWALIQVKALIELFGPDKPGREVLQDFDLVAANSGGSIVLGCLVEDLSLSEILAFFNDEAQRKSIFSKSDSLVDRALHDIAGLGPKYSQKNKLSALRHALPQRGNLSLADAIAGIRRAGVSEGLHVLITSFDYDRNRATFFRSTPATGPELWPLP